MMLQLTLLQRKSHFFRVGSTLYLSSSIKVFNWKIICFLLCGRFLINWSPGGSANSFKKSIFYNVLSLHNDGLDFVWQNFNLKFSTTTNLFVEKMSFCCMYQNPDFPITSEKFFEAVPSRKLCW